MKTNLNLFDKLMIAITFAEANEPIPAMTTDTPDNSNRSRKTLHGKDNNSAALLNGALGTKSLA